MTVPQLDKKSESQNWSKRTSHNDWFKIKLWYSHVMLTSKSKYSYYIYKICGKSVFKTKQWNASLSHNCLLNLNYVDSSAPKRKNWICHQL